jgi:glycosyltransferase involved in cell wall biosynthesis
MAPNKSALLLFLGDPTTDRRVQSFARLFREAGWNAEIIAPASRAIRGPRKFAGHHQALGHALQNKRADVVVACDLYSLSAARGMKERGDAKILIYDSREVYAELPSVASQPLRRTIWKRLERRGLMQTDLIIVTAPHDLQAILDVHGFVPKSMLVRNLPWKNDAIQPNVDALRSLGIPETAKTVVYLGGIQAGRGLIVLVDAMRSIEAHLLLIGDGAIRSELEEQARSLSLTDRVHFSGPMQSEDALRVAAACDAGVAIVEPISKSYEFALPSKIFEYMMAGLPVITNPMKHVLELFGEKPWLSYVEPNNAGSIVEGIRRAFTISNDIRNAERELALKQYHFEADATPLITLLS